MSEDVFVPKLGQTVEEVVLIGWLVEDGAKVDFGDPVLEVETDKAIFNVEANAKGFIHFGPVEMGATVPVLTVVATIGKQDEGFSPGGEEKPSELDQVEEALVEKRVEIAERVKKEVIPAAHAPEGKKKVFASPRAKRLARQNQVDLAKVVPTGGEGIRVVEGDVIAYLGQKPKATPIAAELASEVGLDISEVVGTGKKGTVTRTDVEGAIREKLAMPSAAPMTPPAQINYADIKIAEVKPLRSVRKLIFDRMSNSVHTTSRVTLVTEADATDLVTFREKLKVEKTDAWGFTPGYNDLLGVIVARTLRSYPYMNARLSEDGKAIEILEDINLGMAVDTERGLLVPVIRNADQADLQAFGARFRELVEAAQSGRISPEDLSGGTFTITNLGNYDVDAFTPVINLPEIAILGIGRIVDKVVPYQDKIQVRKVVTLSLVFDHRLVDGAPAARFLQKVKETIEYPIMIFV